MRFRLAPALQFLQSRMQPMIDRHRGRGDKAMKLFTWHSTAIWTALSLLFLLLALLFGPARALAGVAPLGPIADGQGFVDQTGQTFTFTGTFRLPFALDPQGGRAKPRQHQNAYYLDDYRTPVPVLAGERSIGWPTVRLEIKF